eukprot:7577414-Pyramimonas_sp.AAC.1
MCPIAGRSHCRAMATSGAARTKPLDVRTALQGEAAHLKTRPKPTWLRNRHATTARRRRLRGSPGKKHRH